MAGTIRTPSAAGPGPRATVVSCWLCGIRGQQHQMVPDGGSGCGDIRWSCKDTRACTDRWTSARRQARAAGVSGRSAITAPPVGYFKYDKVRKQITPVSDDTVIRRFRADCVLSASLPALQPYDPSDPPPVRFVRHATAHCVRPEQHPPVNAVVAAMLMTSMLREARSSGW